MNRVIHFEIQADNIARAQKFYREAFGWEIKQAMSKAEGGPMDYWLLMTGEAGPGINGGLYERPQKKEEQYHVYDCTIDVKDIDKAIAAVKACGGRITRDKMELPKVGWFASALDSEGNRFGLMQATGPEAK